MASTPSPPMVIFSDYTCTPAISLAYSTFNPSVSRKNNTIYFKPAYKHIKSLLVHPPCSHLLKDPYGYCWPCELCEALFIRKFWDGARVLLDYFADFSAKDSAVMQSIWFHLFDIWQESAFWLPFREIQDRIHPKVDAWLHKTVQKARSFEKSYMDTIDLVELVIWGRKGRGGTHYTQDRMLYDPHGDAATPMRMYETGPWISGIKPWAQFLSSGGPGVSPPMPLSRFDTGSGKLTKREVLLSKRYIPHSAIGLIRTHVERARAIADSHYRALDKENRNDRLRSFDANSPIFPTPHEPTHSFVSPLVTAPGVTSPRKIMYTLVNGAPPIQRPEAGEYADLDLQCLKPDWNLLDEAVALCRGWPAYEAAGEVHDGDDDDNDNGEEEEDEDEEPERVFDMWSVIETRGGEENRGGGKKEEVLVLGDMFDNWCSVGECLK